MHACVYMYVLVTAAVPHLREIKFHKMWWMPVFANPAVWQSVCVPVCVLQFCQHISAILWDCTYMRVHRKCPCHCSEGWIRFGEAMLRAAMLWVELVIIVTMSLVPTDQANVVYTRKTWVGQQSQIATWVNSWELLLICKQGTILPQKHFLSAILTSFTYLSVIVQRREKISIFNNLLDYCSTIKLLLKLLFSVSLLQNVKTAWNLQTGGRLPLQLHLVSLQLCCCSLKWGNGTGWRGRGGL